MKITINWNEHEISELEAVRLLTDLESREQFPKMSEVLVWKKLATHKEMHVTKKIEKLRKVLKMPVEKLWDCIWITRLTAAKRLSKWWWTYNELLTICRIFDLKLSDLEDWRSLPTKNNDKYLI